MSFSVVFGKEQAEWIEEGDASCTFPSSLLTP